MTMTTTLFPVVVREPKPAVLPRTLKVALIGDFWAGKVCPQIRLQGKWLETAGIHGNARVQVENPEPGVLVIRTV